MKKLYITFSGNAWNPTTQQIVERAPRYGVDEVRVYDDAWLMKTEFYKLPANRWIWEHRGIGNTGKYPRGFGWFCWKPFVILHALEHFCEPGDVVLYTDADTYPIADLSILYKHCIKLGGAMVFAASGHVNRWWVKHDTYRIVGGLDGVAVNEWFRRYANADHGVGRFMLFQKGPWQVQQFLMEWLTFCLHRLATTFEKSVLGEELPDFRESRSEQSIFSLLCAKFEWKLHREACQFGEGHQEDRDLYPQLFYQDGLRVEYNPEAGSKYRNV